MLDIRRWCPSSLDLFGAVSILRGVRPDSVLPRRQHALARIDRWAIERLTLAVVPFRFGAVVERLVVSAMLMAFAAWLLLPVAGAVVPERVVHVAGLGWVDAAAVPGLPRRAADGEQWALRRLGESAGSAVGPAAIEVPAAKQALAVGARVSLNGASVEELEALPGIGPALAARIVAARPFGAVAALDRVRGIGPRTYARLAPLVEL